MWLLLHSYYFILWYFGLCHCITWHVSISVSENIPLPPAYPEEEPVTFLPNHHKPKYPLVWHQYSDALHLYFGGGLLGSNLGWDISYSDWDILLFSSVPSGKCCDSTSITSQQLPSKFCQIQYSSISCQVISLQLYKKTTSYKIEKMHLLHIFLLSPIHLWLCCSNFINPPKKNSLGCAANRKTRNRKSQRLISTLTYSIHTEGTIYKKPQKNTVWILQTVHTTTQTVLWERIGSNV
jgi:hypothetical protein